MKNLFIASLIVLIFSAEVSASTFAIGDYVQDTVISENASDLFNGGLGLHFDGYRTYGPGNFSSYTRSGAGYAKAAAVILLERNYSNIQSKMCVQNVTALRSPVHHMSEEITINSSKLSYYEPGTGSCSHDLEMNITPYAVIYKVNTGYIPMKRITRDPDTSGCSGYNCYVDYEYRGKMLFFGQEYYVKDIYASSIYLDKGSELNVSSTGFNAEYNGYRFRSERIINESPYACNYLILYVMKPNGTLVSVRVSNIENGRVDDLEISAMDWQSPRIIIYNLSTEVVLQDGKEAIVSGQVMRGWNVYYALVDLCNDTEPSSDGLDNDCSLPEYADMNQYSQDALLKSVSVSYGIKPPQPEEPWEPEIPPVPTTLGVNESLIFPNGLFLRFRGYLNANLQEITCPAHESIYATYFLGSMEQGWTTTTSSTTTTTTQPACNTAGFLARGKYVKDTVIAEAPTDLLDANKGFHFDDAQYLRKGSFTTYLRCGQDASTTPADLLSSGSYDNVENLLGYTGVLSSWNTYHDMEERIVINSSRLRYYETAAQSNCSSTLRLAIQQGAVSYRIYPDYIPIKRIEKDPELTGCVGVDCYMDYQYRGKMLFLGNGYYVKDIDAGTIRLANGTLLAVSNEGYDASYKGYSFRLHGFIYDSPGNVSAIVLDIRALDHSVSQETINGSATTVAGDLQIAAVDWESSGTWLQASIIAYDPASEIILADGQDLSIGGHVWTGWKVSFATVDNCYDTDEASDGSVNDCALAEYQYMTETMQATLLKSVSLTYDHDISGSSALHINDSLDLPNGFFLRFKGYLSNDSRPVSCPVTAPVYASYFIGTKEEATGTTTTTTTAVTTTLPVTTTTTTSTTSTTQASCTLAGDNPPCGNVSLSEVINYINAWATGQADLSDVVRLINAWASSG